MSILHWPAEDRPREKLLLKGAQALTDAELIAIFIQTGLKGKTALDIAKELLVQHGGIKPLLQASTACFIETPGIGKAKYAALQAAVELGKRYLQPIVHRGVTIKNSQQTQQILTAKLTEYPNEVFACLFLDNHCRLICYEELFQGTINEARVYPREIVRRALFHNAAQVILAHNHPSGRAWPSSADKEVTLQIQQALQLVDIQVADHIIIGAQTSFSFADAGIIT